MDFWAVFTPKMVKYFTGEYYDAWLCEACEAMLGFKNSYLEDFYWEFVDPETSEDRRMDILGSFIGGCIKNNEKLESKKLAIVDSTESENGGGDSYASKKGCVSDVILKYEETTYDTILDESASVKFLAELEEMRTLILEETGSDIYMLFKHALAAQKGMSITQRNAQATLNEIMEAYKGMKQLIKDTFSIPGSVDYIMKKLDDVSYCT